jgi:hypothetical protein
MGLIRVIIHVDCNGVKVVKERQLHDKINTNVLPGSRRNFLRL